MARGGPKLGLKKCIFVADRTPYLGHVISTQGVATDPAKVEAIVKLAPPETVCGVRIVLGMFNYYRRFIPHFADMACWFSEQRQVSACSSTTAGTDRCRAQLYDKRTRGVGGGVVSLPLASLRVRAACQRVYRPRGASIPAFNVVPGGPFDAIGTGVAGVRHHDSSSTRLSNGDG